jgi:hypothetical protein
MFDPGLRRDQLHGAAWHSAATHVARPVWRRYAPVMRRAAEVLDLDAAPVRCAGCNSLGQVVPILYGFHTPEAEARTRSGSAVLGGFSRGPNGPRWECLVCGARV